MNWFIKRTGQAIFTLWAVATLSFGLIRLMPGGAADIMASRLQQQAQGSNIPREQLREMVASQLNVDPDAPIHEAYYQYMSALVQGDFGNSIRYGGEVNAIIADTLPWTLFLMSLSTLGMFAIALSLGAIMAYKEGSTFDLANTGVGILLSSIPTTSPPSSSSPFWVIARRCFPSAGATHPASIRLYRRVHRRCVPPRDAPGTVVYRHRLRTARAHHARQQHSGSR